MAAEVLLGDQALAAALIDLPEWQVDGDAIRREYVAENFRAALAFVAIIGNEAEAANHHPDIDIRYRRVIVTCTTHDVGGITARDTALAARLDAGFVGTLR